ncbi:hypothetical protein CL176_07360 [Suicoccus acidiformans]|uniref:HTH gntR-type domain-containing protein n=1 Tax=Suicoccus acidiformans TaxID=2036206 RepID=A0A347WL71_9LACT|nr:PLP-dependent aminotransferase family protein [Suicoccus acidiformans]AXY25828.1 hypothetical protein CL176_07360 [Suicoccus acidiformans]
MLIPLNPHSSTPLYIQVYQALKGRILDNSLPYESKLPSKRHFAQLNGISQNTVLKAYEQLMDEGYIYAHERRGYFVSDVKHHFILEASPPENQPLPAETKAESDLLDLSRSNPDPELFPFDQFRKLYQKHLNTKEANLLGATDAQGLLSLRQALVSYLQEARGVPATAQQIVLGPSTQALLQLLLPLLAHQESIGIENPGYHRLNPLFKEYGLTLIPLTVHEDGIDLAEVMSYAPDLLFLTPSHQFPTGSIMPIEKRLDLLHWVQTNPERYIIEDDYDSEFKYSGIPVPALVSLDQAQRVIYMGSFSRNLAPSLRLSYMVLPPKLIEDFQAHYPYLAPSLSTLEQYVLADYIQSGKLERHLNKARSFYKKKRDALLHTIQRLDPEAIISGDQAGLHILFQPSIAFDEGQVRQKALANGVKLTFLSDYRFQTERPSPSYIFLSFSAVAMHEIEPLIEQIYQWLA